MKNFIGIYDGTLTEEKYDAQVLASASQDGLMSAEDKAKLDTLSGGGSGSSVSINANMVVQDEAHRFVSDTEKAEWSNKASADSVNKIIDGSTVVPKAADAVTVNGYSVEANVPADAKFTDTVYVHPESHEATMIVEDEAHRFVSDVEKAAWNALPADKTAIGLGNVTDDAQVKRSEMGVAGGVATLDDAGVIPAAQLPGFVDDIIEEDSVEKFPVTGESGKLYVDITTNKTYRWTGTQYVEIPDGGLALGETAATAYAGDKGKAVTDTVNSILNGSTVVPNATKAVTVNGYSVEANVPADAKFTDTVYVHPESHEATMIVESTEKRFVSDVEKAAWNAKASAEVVNAIINGDTVVAKATDASFVNGHSVEANVPENAKFTDTVYVHPESHEATMIVESTEKRFVSDAQIAYWNDKADVTLHAPYYDENDNAVYGCGCGITIEDAEEEGKIKILWADTEGAKELIAPEGINVYGGGDGVDVPLNYPSACVTMNSGLVKYLYGGNRRGNVGNVIIVVNGGSFVEGNGGIVAGGHSAGTRESIVGHAEVIINDTDNEATLVYAGGQGLAVVGTTKLTVNGGSINYLTAGGSNGTTYMAEVIVNDGNIKVLQGCNRGTVGSIQLKVNGGTIDNMYAGGETGDASVDATYKKSEVFITGGTITSISAGTNGGVEDASKVSGTYVDGSIKDEVATTINLIKTNPIIPTEPYYDETLKSVFSCGIPVVIEASDTEGFVNIIWEGTDKSNKSIQVPTDTQVYGGGNGEEYEASYPSTFVTMNSGTIDLITAGSRGNASIGRTTVIMNGGSLDCIQGGGRASVGSDGTSANSVGFAEIIVNDGDIIGPDNTGTIFGGGNGYSRVASCKVTFNGGSVSYAMPSGSNGHTGNGEFIVNGGNIKLLQGCNRGTVNNIKLIVNSGIIEKMYAGGETEDTSVTAVYDKSEICINGGTINNIYAGTNGGVVDASKVSGTYVEGSITDEQAATMNLNKTLLIDKFQLAIEGTTLILKNGSTVISSIDLESVLV